jgi:hypothetical protein
VRGGGSAEWNSDLMRARALAGLETIEAVAGELLEIMRLRRHKYYPGFGGHHLAWCCFEALESAIEAGGGRRQLSVLGYRTWYAVAWIRNAANAYAVAVGLMPVGAFDGIDDAPDADDVISEFGAAAAELRGIVARVRGEQQRFRVRAVAAPARVRQEGDAPVQVQATPKPKPRGRPRKVDREDRHARQIATIVERLMLAPDSTNGELARALGCSERTLTRGRRPDLVRVIEEVRRKMRASAGVGNTRGYKDSRTGDFNAWEMSG